ncbi:hypothetical protein Pla52o_55690 [Novipirellula galeiformis]|uniref:Uncharacterized protein n=1 Tax=Novipirellula galeiformis TaxID=2528004 RepID=A0A5C6BT92_9BACT|nr:hypothetical protein Pla52o_55690 [Novipirellula galeiformis]
MQDDTDPPRLRHRILSGAVCGFAGFVIGLLTLTLINCFYDVSDRPFANYVIYGASLIATTAGVTFPRLTYSAAMFLAHVLVP